MRMICLILTGLIALPASADAADPTRLMKGCRVCHEVRSPAGEKIVAGGRAGPNLYGIMGAQAGTNPDYPRYFKDLVRMGEEGLIWTEDTMTAFLADPQKFSQDWLGDTAAESGMRYKGTGHEDLIRWLASPAAGAQPAPEREPTPQR